MEYTIGQDSEETTSLVSKVLLSATEEILIIFSHANALNKYEKTWNVRHCKKEGRERD